MKNRIISIALLIVLVFTATPITYAASNTSKIEKEYLDFYKALMDRQVKDGLITKEDANGRIKALEEKIKSSDEDVIYDRFTHKSKDKSTFEKKAKPELKQKPETKARPEKVKPEETKPENKPDEKAEEKTKTEGKLENVKPEDKSKAEDKVKPEVNAQPDEKEKKEEKKEIPEKKADAENKDEQKRKDHIQKQKQAQERLIKIYSVLTDSTVDEVKTKCEKQDKNIWQLANAEGQLGKFKEAVIADVKKDINSKVEKGELTKEKGEEIIARFSEHIGKINFD